MAQNSIGWMPPLNGAEIGVLHHIMHALGRLEEGQRLNRQSGEERAESLRQHVDTRIEDLHAYLGGRIDRLELRQHHRMSPMWKELPWKHMLIFGVGGWLLVHGHITAPELKGLLLRYLGLL